MSLFSYFRHLWRNLTGRKSVERELDREMSAYLSLLVEEKVRQGMSPPEALRAAQLEIGGVQQVKENVREIRAGFVLQTILQDARYGLRSLRRSPTFTVVAILALALGIGATTTIFSVVHGVLLSSLPYPGADQLAVVYVHFSPQNAEKGTLSIADYLDWKAQNRAFEQPQVFRYSLFDVTGGKEPEQLQGILATAGFFSVLRVHPLIGRTFLPEEDGANADRVVVIGEAWWRRSFAGDPGILGHKLNLNGVPCTVVGVMPGSFYFPRPRYELWTNLRLVPPKRRGPFGLRGLARLRPGVTWDRAQAETNAIGSRMERENPQSYRQMSMPIEPLRDALIGKAQMALLALFGSVLVLLVISAVNVACLQLARATAREKEIALRISLGAGGGRLLRQLLTESLLLSLLGGIAGCLLAYFGIQALRAWNPGNLPRIETVRLDAGVLLFALGISLATGILFGLVPALHGRRDALATSLREGGRGGTTRASRRRLQAILVTGEMALALVLLTGAGLLARSFLLLEQVQSGAQAPPRQVLSMQVSPSASKNLDSRRMIAFYDRLLARVRILPGVALAAVSDSLPPDRQYDYDTFTIQGQQFAPGEQNPAVTCPIVSADYFRALGIPLVRGRYFTDRDNADAPPVAIVSESLARRFLPGVDPIGGRLKAVSPYVNAPYMEIVGVVRDVRYTGLDSDDGAAYYQPYMQSMFNRRTNLVVRSESAASLAATLRREIRELDNEAAVSDVITMEQAIGNSVAQPRFRTMLIGAFALCALLLAAIGIYGVIAYSVSQRTQEIGIRMALGAPRSSVLGSVVAQGLRLALLGTVLGIAGGLLATRLLTSLLFAVKATDVVTFSIGPLILILVALIASFVPACRAARVDPVIALRHE